MFSNIKNAVAKISNGTASLDTTNQTFNEKLVALGYSLTVDAANSKIIHASNGEMDLIIEETDGLFLLKYVTDFSDDVIQCIQKDISRFYMRIIAANMNMKVTSLHIKGTEMIFKSHIIPDGLSIAQLEKFENTLIDDISLGLQVMDEV